VTLHAELPEQEVEPEPQPEPEPEPELTPDAQQALLVLDGALDALGAAHHRPFSRG
jgi:hypothetical protein